MIDPLFWLGLSILLVAVSLTAVLVAALPVLQELARAARSAEKLFDTLRRDLPPTLEAIRLTGLEISDLTDDVSDGVKSAGQAVKKVEQGVGSAAKQAKNIEVSTRSVFVGVKAAWKSLTRTPATRRSIDRLPPPQKTAIQLRRQASPNEDVEATLEENRPHEKSAYRNHNNYRERRQHDNSSDLQPSPEDYSDET